MPPIFFAADTPRLLQRLLPATVALLLCSSPARSQCSDAGVCSLGHAGGAGSGHTLAVSYTYGTSGKPEILTFHSVDLSGAFQVLDDAVISATVPFASQSGPLGSAAGIGDLALLWDQTVSSANGLTLRVMAGVKLATGSVSSGSLPQRYQSGLGTNDILVGVSLETGDWNFGAAYQFAGGRSDNPVDRLGRGDDLLLRAGYRLRLPDVVAAAEILFIQRVQESTILSSGAGQPETFAAVPGSNQTQINLLGRASLPLGDALSLTGIVAVPVLQRTFNLDGLKRALTLSAGLALFLR